MEAEGGFTCSESNFRLILNGLGYRFGKIDSRPVVFERQDLINWRKGYLRELHVYRQRGYRIVYMDETWVFAGMSQRYDWVDEDVLLNPYEAKRNGLMTGPKTPVSRGKRAIVVHCVAEDGLVDGTDFIFASHATDDDGDYHRDMDAAKFEAYLRRIAPILKAGSNQPVVLILGNASCNSRYEEKSAIHGFFSHVREAEKRYATLDEILLDNPACELVISAVTFVNDSDSEDEVDVME
uniref:Uncharacterized protein n=1 Tax=Plectus sambesii TaxID=2011161 RepID=A0A914V2X1_9BILA